MSLFNFSANKKYFCSCDVTITLVQSFNVNACSLDI